MVSAPVNRRTALETNGTALPVILRALLVDDEELARRGLRVRLERTDDISLVGEYENGATALPAIRQVAPDLVFLDIQMPGMSGLELAAALDSETSPHVIFVTAFDSYAVKAFDVHALDYILKPVDDARLEAALARARQVVQGARDRDFGRRVALALASINPVAAPPPEQPPRLLVRAGDRMIVIRVEEIDWIEASGDYVSIHVGKKSWRLRESIAAVADRYAAHGIVRIHRSTLVKIDRVNELRPLANGEFTVLLRDATELKMSRSYRSALEVLGAT